MAFWTVAWFIASVVWAAGQSKLIQYTSPHRIFIELAREGCQADKCKSLGAPGFGTLAFSAVSKRRETRKCCVVLSSAKSPKNECETHLWEDEVPCLLRAMLQRENHHI